MTGTKLKQQDVEGAVAAAERVVDVHRALAEFLEPGLTLAQIDRFVGEKLTELGCKSCFYGYRAGGAMPPFPSQACLSVNECVVHGTAGYYEAGMKPGDVLKIDIGVSYKGWIGDAAWTYVFGEMTPEVKRLTDVGKRSLELGVQELQPGAPLLNWAEAVQSYVEDESGLHLVRGLGGHGYGRKLHAPPHVSNTRPRYPGEWPDASTLCKPGMLLAVEPMLALGTGDTAHPPRTWPIYTADGSLAAHYEHDVLITEDGPRVLTAALQDLPDVIPC